ncbi:ATP-binding cassette subfamily B protein [Blastococcus colisei]|uniref:ATP-binding cassette subfamily B protein n=1 Tax=Blastococcus colisei TaxID=1564162 RepID=A0A543PHZ6_9ACTN|nr:ABC transporter ATP-binding protein [Blastococcus colisei]TQN43679.1 ATP-binding cassette subfamily B protein [Blastococcus colisei]
MTARIVGRPPPVRLSRHLGSLVSPWRARLLAVGVLVLAAAVVELVPPLVVRHVIDHSLVRGNVRELGTAAAVYLAAATAVAALSAGYGYLAATVAQRSLAVLRTRLFSHLLALPTGYHDRTPVGDSISRTTADIDAIDDLFSSSVAGLLGQVVRLLTLAVAMTVLSPILAAAAALVIPPLLLVTNVLRRRVRDAERATRIAVGAVNARLAEDLSGVEVIRAFGRQLSFADRVRRALRTWLQAGNRSVLFNAFYAPVLGVLAAVVTALLLWLGGRDALGAFGVTVGTLTAFVLLFARFFTPLVNLGDEWQTVQGALAGAERVFAVLELPTDAGGPTGPADLAVGGSPPAAAAPSAPGAACPRTRPVIEVEDVSFGYLPGRPVLHGISLTVSAGQHVAIVGRTGAGKSSILSLLAGLHAPWSGRVALAGGDPTGMDDGTRRALLGYVPQTVALFSGTVADNITLGDPELTAEQVRGAARISGADSFIEALPDRYDTVLSDTGRGCGVQLSAGQRQLLALSRALVTEPAVLLLDEPTSVVDGAGDAAFRDALRDRVLPGGTAVLTVAHRLATARDADHVLVVAHGRVVEEGDPSSLLARQSRLADLAALELAGWDWQDQPDASGADDGRPSLQRSPGAGQG